MIPIDPKRRMTPWPPALHAPAAVAFALIALAAPDAPAAVSVPDPGQGGIPVQAQGQAEQVTGHLARRDFDAALTAARSLVQSNADNPAAHNLLGVASQGKGDLAAARAAFEKAIALKSDYVPALMNLAQIEFDRGDLDSAGARYQAALAVEPKQLFAMIGLARIEFSRRRNEAGYQWLERAKAASPDTLAPRLLLATQWLRDREFLKALAEMHAVARANPRNPEVLELLGQAQLATGRMTDAIATYQRLATLQPASPLPHYRLATAQISQGALAAARDSLTKALRLKPDHVDSLRALSALELQAGRFEESLKPAMQLQLQQPRLATGWVLEGDILVARQLTAQALPAYERAFSLEPSGATLIKLHAAELASGVPKATADARLQAWLQAHPDDVRVRRYQASEAMRAGQTQEAIVQFQRVVQSAPNDGIALNNLAGLYHRQNDPRALELAEKAHALMPGSAATADTLGWILVGRGLTPRGLELLKKAAALEPANPEVAYHLAAALAKAGEKAKARVQLEKLLARVPAFPQREDAKALLARL